MSAFEVRDEGALRIITLTNSARRNALSAELLTGIRSALDASPVPRVAILRADRQASTWSAGHDISEIPRGAQDPLSWANPLEQFLLTIERLPFPVIAAVHGGVWGGACDVVMTCDLVVASRDATFAITPTKLGVPYNGYGVGHFLSALPNHIAKEMFFTAEPISAQRAYELGAVNTLVDAPDHVHERAEAMAHVIMTRAPLSIRAIKAEFTALSSPPPQPIATHEYLTDLRRSAWESRDFREGLQAFDERRSPAFTGE